MSPRWRYFSAHHSMINPCTNNSHAEVGRVSYPVVKLSEEINICIFRGLRLSARREARGVTYVAETRSKVKKQKIEMTRLP